MSLGSPAGNTVLVVGAGPSGLVTAAELIRHGVACRIIDKLPERSDKSRALAVHARSLEMFENMGIIEQALASGNRVYGANVYYKGERIVHISTDELESPYPFVLTLPQSTTEQILEEHLERLGGKVERGVELVAVRQEDKMVACRLRHPDGSEEDMRTYWLVGCDGAHSTVRKMLGLPFEGEAYEEAFALADVRIEWSNPPDEAHIFMSEEGVAACFPFGKSRYRIILDERPEAIKSEQPTLDEFQRYLERRGTRGAVLKDPHWLAWFKIHRRQVGTYRVDRVLLAGDAAHIHSPVGGQGMNTGMQDAYNLAWKLALVIKGAAAESLINSYHLERYPIARALLQGTDLATKVATIRNPVAQQVRNSLISFLTAQDVIQQRLLKTGSMVAVNYRNSNIVGEHRGSLTEVNIFGGRDSEKPDMRAWLDFLRGPAPGDRAPDATVRRAPAREPARLFEIIRGTGHSLLLLDGVASTAEGYRNLELIGSNVSSRYGQHIDVHMVVPAAAVPRELSWQGSLLLDPEMDLHKAYGANSECLYLIRPDGYIGFRSQPAHWPSLEAYLKRIFK